MLQALCVLWSTSLQRSRDLLFHCPIPLSATLSTTLWPFASWGKSFQHYLGLPNTYLPPLSAYVNTTKQLFVWMQPVIPNHLRSCTNDQRFCAKIVGRDRPTSSVAKLHLFFILSFFCAILPSLDWFLTEMLEATGLPLNCITLSLSGSLTDAPFYIFWESLMHSYIERKILEITAINIISLHYMHTVSL